jgi:microcystin degradation protein MlrC
MEIGIAGLSHETHTFLPDGTGVEPFERDALRGDAIVERLRESNTVVAGFLDALEEAPEPVNCVPAVHARGGVSGTVDDEVYDRYVTEITSAFAARELDAVLLFLHGAMVTESHLDTETDAVRAVRSVVGDDVPIGVGMDLHGNVGPDLLDVADVVCAYRSSPHVDQRETGRRTATTVLDAVRGRVSPTTAVAEPGVVVPSVFSATTVSPAKDAVTRAVTWEHYPEFHDVARWTEKDDVLDVSLFFGFAWADVPQLGVAAVATTDDAPELARQIVDDLSRFVAERRREFTNPDSLCGVSEGVERALRRGAAASDPVVLLDHADRLAETTFVLRELLEQDASNVAVPLVHDPEAVADCRAAGEGNEVDLLVGSKTSERGGGPVSLTARVEFVGTRTYTASGPMKRGEEVTQGETAIVDADGVWLQLTSRMDGAGLTDTDPIEQYGYDVTDFDVVVTKSKTHFRGVFEELAEEIVVVDAPEYSPADLSGFDYSHVSDGVFPITDDGSD